MEFATNIGAVILGGVVLYLGAEWLVKGAAGLARAVGTHEIIVGLTVIAYGTSAPELVVTVAANLGDSTPLAFGTVLGSCVTNLGLILGFTAIIAPPIVAEGLIRKEIPLLVLSSVILVPMLQNGVVSRLESLVLLGVAVGFTLLTLFSTRIGATRTAADIEATAEAAGAPSGEGIARLVVITIVGLGLLVGGGELFVEGAKGIALLLGMSERLVGLTIVAFGTSLPELAASLVAAFRGHSGLAIGNVIGSNIFNVFLVLGAAGSIRALSGELASLSMELGFLVGITLFGAIAMRKSRVVSRFEGLVFVSVYVAFVTSAILGD